MVRTLLCFLLLVTLILSGCEQQAQPLRIGTNIWPGYEPLYLAREWGAYDSSPIRLVEMPSSSDVMSALRRGLLEGAALTLDEALLMASEGIDLNVVLVCDRSLGADVILARPGIESLEQLAGQTIAAETTAVGAVMLHAALQQANLEVDDVVIRHLDLAEHIEAYRKGDIDASVTFDPYRTRLQQLGARAIFSSADIPDRIVDVLVIRREVIAQHENAIAVLVEGFFNARKAVVANQPEALTIINRRLRLSEQALANAYKELSLPSVAENHRLLSGDQPPLERQANTMTTLMLQQSLLARMPVSPLRMDARFLPANL